jgi:hypothetical protein
VAGYLIHPRFRHLGIEDDRVSPATPVQTNDKPGPHIVDDDAPTRGASDAQLDTVGLDTKTIDPSFVDGMRLTHTPVHRVALSAPRYASSIKFRPSEFLDAIVDKGSHPIRIEIRMGIDDMHGNWLRLELLQHIFETADFAERRDLIGKKHAETQAIRTGA